MFAGLAGFVSRYAKVILAVWVIAMLIIVPVASKSFSSSDISLIGSEGTESQEGYDILQHYFHSTGIEDNPVLVLGYDSPSGYTQFYGNEKTGNIAQYIIKWFSNSAEWNPKLEKDRGVYVLGDSVTAGSGVVALGFVYKSTYSGEKIIYDTPELRSAVDEAISCYLNDLGVTVKHFNSYLTGNSAMLYDSGNSTIETLFIALIVVILIAAILMGLFFGSVLTSIISVVSISFSALLTMTFLYLLSISLVIHTIIWIMVMFICVALAFSYCVFFISAYKRQLLDGTDKDDALENTILKTGKISLVIGVCILASALAFSLYNGVILRPLGLGLFVATVSVMLVSFTVPASLICITKNEGFWMRSVDGTMKATMFEKNYRFIQRISNTVTTSLDRFLDRRYIPVIIVVSIITVGSAAYVVSSDLNSNDYDLTDSMMVGDSAKGIDELKAHSMGGLLQPYTVVLECDSNIGSIVRVTEPDPLDPLNVKEHYELRWTDGYDIVGLKHEVERMQASLLSCDTTNIAYTTTFEVWQDVVRDARDSGATDPSDIIETIRETLGTNNIIAYQGFEDAYKILSDEGYTDSQIVDDPDCGARIDYTMNAWLSDLGFLMVSTGDVVIDYIAVSVFTKDTCTSDGSTSTANKIIDCANALGKESKYFSHVWVCGTGVMYKSVYNEVSTAYLPLVVLAFLMIFIIMLIAERDISVPISIAATSTVSVFISEAIIMGVLSLTIGSISHTVIMMLPLFAITFSLWFGYMQIGMMRGCGTISDMKKEFNPVIIVTSLVIALGSLLLVFSDIAYVSLMGFTMAIMILVDAFIVRLVLAPAVWKYGIIHKVKYFERYSSK